MRRSTAHYGEALGIVGPNGSGKSTLLKAIAGLVQPASGSCACSIGAPREVPPGTIAYVPQVEAVDWQFPGNRARRRCDGALSAARSWFQPFGAHDRDVVARASDALDMGDLQTATSPSSRADSSSARSSRARSRRSRSCCCSTSRRPASTRRPKNRCCTSCASWSRDGLPVLMTTHDLDRADGWFDRLIVSTAASSRSGRPTRWWPPAHTPRFASTRTRTATAVRDARRSKLARARFSYAFMQRAFVAALVVGMLCSTMGTYVVLRKLSFIGDGIAHASFAGIVDRLSARRELLYRRGVVAVITALGIGFVHRRGRISLDTTIGVLFTGILRWACF